MLVEIDERYCIGCGRCVDDCVGANLEVEGVTARVKGLCILCGHCVAVCPTGAVSIPSYDMADVETCVPAGAAVDPRTMLRVVKSRRSVRDYLSLIHIFSFLPRVAVSLPFASSSLQYGE